MLLSRDMNVSTAVSWFSFSAAVKELASARSRTIPDKYTHFGIPDDQQNIMASGIAIEECESSFTSPCLQAGCLHLSASTDGIASDTSLITLDPTTASSSFNELAPDLKPYHVLDLNPASTNPPAAPPPETSTQHLHNGDGGGGNDTLGDQGPEKYVTIKCHRPYYDSNSHFQISVSESRIPITRLRPCEQNVAYEAILSRAPAHMVPEYYALHLSRLDEMRAAIAEASARNERQGARIWGWRVRTERMGPWAQSSEWERVEEAMRDYEGAVRAGGKLSACERGVERLLERCEGLLEGKAGFEPVIWRRAA